jgi:hypothetical protein
VDERLLFDQLPHYLRGEVASFLTDDMLRESRAFGNLESSSRRLVRSATTAAPAGTIPPAQVLLPTACGIPTSQYPQHRVAVNTCVNQAWISGGL